MQVKSKAETWSPSAHQGPVFLGALSLQKRVLFLLLVTTYFFSFSVFFSPLPSNASDVARQGGEDEAEKKSPGGGAGNGDDDTAEKGGSSDDITPLDDDSSDFGSFNTSVGFGDNNAWLDVLNSFMNTKGGLSLSPVAPMRGTSAGDFLARGGNTGPASGGNGANSQANRADRETGKNGQEAEGAASGEAKMQASNAGSAGQQEGAKAAQPPIFARLASLLNMVTKRKHWRPSTPSYFRQHSLALVLPSFRVHDLTHYAVCRKPSQLKSLRACSTNERYATAAFVTS